MANAGECNYCASERAVYDLRKQCCAVRIALAHWDVRGSDGVKVLLSALAFFAKDDYIEAVRKEVVRVLRERAA